MLKQVLLIPLMMTLLHSSPLWLPKDASSHRHAEVTAIPAERKAVVAELEGPAVINHIWITAQCEIPEIYGLMILRIWWDEEKEPSVEVPLGDFFAMGFGKQRKFKSLMAEMIPSHNLETADHSSLNCWWEMPFRKSCRIEIENRGKRTISMFFIQLDYEKPKSLPEDTLYFHAQYRRENPVKRGAPYTILYTEGKGEYVGTVMNYHLLEPGAWVEGGNTFYIDGEEKPSMPGTGGEDYFGHAWGFRLEENALYHGTSYGPVDQKMTAYRWHVPDPIHFKKSIRATMLAHGWDVGDREDDYSSVAFWYQDEPHAKFPALPPVDYDYLEVADIYRRSAEDAFEIQLNKIPFEGRNLSLKAEDYAESGHFQPDQAGRMALDGDPKTKWCDVENPQKHWLAVDLGEECEVEGFVLKNPGFIGDLPAFDVAEYRIEKGESLKGPWETLYKGENSQGRGEDGLTTSSLNVISLEKPVKGQFFRLLVTKGSFLDPVARIQEFEIWGECNRE